MLQLPQQYDKEVAGKSLMPGAILVRDEAQKLAPSLQKATPFRLAGVLKKNIRVANRKNPNPGMTATVVIGVRKLSRALIRKVKRAAYERGMTIAGADIIGNAFYWRFMEFGYTDRGGKWHGPHNGEGFLRPAFKQNSDNAIGLISKASGKQIDRIAKKLGFKVR